MPPYIPYTEEEKQLANSVDLAEFLRLRGEKLERIGREYKLIYTDGTGSHDSITISGSTWYDHKNQIGGGAIRFMRHYYGMNFPTAMQELLGRKTQNNYPVEPHKNLSQKMRNELSGAVTHKEFKLPERNSDMHRVFAYLIKHRHISPEVVTFFAKNHTLYEDKEHHNAVFVGVDEKGVPRQAHKRSANSFGKSFRQTVEGSDTKYSFSYFGKSGKIYIFEAPIDMLSFITMFPNNWQNHSYIAMNGVYENAVLTALENHPELREIVICTDNDEGGIDAADRLSDILHDKGYKNIQRQIPECKDWNEQLKSLKGADFIPSSPHKRKEKYMKTVWNLKYFECCPERLADRISKTFQNRQYRYLAEYALAGSSFFLPKTKRMNTEFKAFLTLHQKLRDEYRAYANKGRITQKTEDLTAIYKQVIADLKNIHARTKEQTIETAKLLFRLSDMAVRCEVQQELTQTISEPTQEEKICHSHSLQALS